MRVQILIPDAAATGHARSALLADEIEVTDGPFEQADVRIVDAGLLPRTRDHLRAFTRDATPVVVTGAPTDPDVLAGYLASGVSAYLCRQESWALLPGIVRDAHAGGYRYDPYVIMSLLKRYRALQQRSTAASVFGRFIH